MKHPREIPILLAVVRNSFNEVEQVYLCHEGQELAEWKRVSRTLQTTVSRCRESLGSAGQGQSQEVLPLVLLLPLALSLSA